MPVSDLAEPLAGIPQNAPAERRPVRGYGLYLIAALLFAFNGTVSKFIRLTGMPPERLSQLRVSAAFVILLAVVALRNRGALRLHQSEVRLLLAYGVLGIAFTQWLYFVAIGRLPVGVALLIEFTAPVMVALWLRFGRGQAVRDRVWMALGLSLLGLALVAQVWKGLTLNGIGVLGAFAAAGALAIYYLLGERGVATRDAVSLTMWGFGAASAFWVVAAPWWTFPWDQLAGSARVLESASVDVPLWVLVLWMVVLGTVVPFALSVAALRHIRAEQASVIGMVEPVLATIIAFLLLNETLAPIQLVGGALVLVGIVLAERSR